MGVRVGGRADGRQEALDLRRLLTGFGRSTRSKIEKVKERHRRTVPRRNGFMRTIRMR